MRVRMRHRGASTGSPSRTLLCSVKGVALGIRGAETARDCGETVALRVPDVLFLLLARAERGHLLVAAAPGTEDFGEGIGGGDEG
jgi:hypothetical protein